MVEQPQYVPPHLQGQIGNIQQDPDGGVSFDHPAGMVGLNPESSRTHLDPEQARATFDEKWRASNQDDAAAKQYLPPRPVMFNERMQRGVGGWLHNHADSITGSYGKNLATSGLLGALAGGAGGAFMAARAGEPMLDKSVLYAILGGLGGAGLSALAQRSGNKSLADAGFAKSASIDSSLMCDSSLTASQRMILADAATRLPYHERSQLENMLPAIAGGGAGLLIAKFLGMRGFLSPLIFAAIGASIGDSMARPDPIYNAMGQLSTENYYAH